MPELSSILRAKFPYPPTKGQEQLFKSLDGLIGSGSEKDTILLTGYAGTGKTTAISTLVDVLPLFNYRYVLLAPTGRAAKVLAAYSGRKAYTIHKIMYKQTADPDSGALQFVRQKNYFKKTVFIVDEASMITDQADLSNNGLLNDIISYIFEHDTNKLILTGDHAQLPPVGYSESPALMADLLTNKYGLQLHHVELKEVLRQEMSSGILENATRLRAQLDHDSPRIRIITKTFKDIYRISREKMEDGLRYAYDKFGLENTIILCRSNWQAVQYNQYIRRNILFFEDELSAGDILMVVRNNYFYLEDDAPPGFIANGDFVEIRKIVNYEEMYGFRYATLDLQMVDYPDFKPFRAKVMLDTLYGKTPSLSKEEGLKLYREVIKDYADITNKKKLKEALQADEYLNALQVKFAYALTCHKSQGGQWKVVFVDVGMNNMENIDSDFIRWLYTAMTRAEKELYLINFDPEFFEE